MNYSAGGIVQSLRPPYARGSKHVPSDTHPTRQVPVAPKGWIRHLPLAILRGMAEIRRIPYGLEEL